MTKRWVQKREDKRPDALEPEDWMEDPRRDCPWKCMQGDPSCVCQAESNRTPEGK